MGNDRLDGKTIIVTGGDSGIGLQCAKDFATRGGKVIIISCDLSSGNNAKKKIILETGNDNIKVKYLDFSDLYTVRKCAEEILKEEPQIHVLLNNAGVAKIGIYKTIDGLDAVTQINYFGPFLFTNILLGRLKESAPSRIVNVSSIAHNLGKLNLNNYGITNSANEWLLYSNSKLAVTHFSIELSRRLRGTGVTSNSLHPGVFFSGIVRTLPSFSQFLWKIVVNVFLKTIEEAAQTSIYLCVSGDAANFNGEFFEDCKKSSPPTKTYDTDMSKKLWSLSEIAVGLQAHETHY
ncbi:retinol dehydrogenase 12-like [Arctopsyche grandis]|uniref:retinol dehydrogenase 12-like n=1 Tax=Arctopsyche grandis TaxID=121162 RepID=UPI00406D69D6